MYFIYAVRKNNGRSRVLRSRSFVTPLKRELWRKIPTSRKSCALLLCHKYFNNETFFLIFSLNRHQYKVRRSPTHISHLLPEIVPMQDLNYSFDTHSWNGAGNDLMEAISPSMPHSHLLKRNVSLLSFRI